MPLPSAGPAPTQVESPDFSEFGGPQGTASSADAAAGVFHQIKKTITSTQAGDSFFSAFVSSFCMIIVSELGDKTFFIAAILAMKHSPGVVFSGALGALAVMTVLASGVGVLLPTLISQTITYWICLLLFFVFGVKLIHDGYTSDGSGVQEEMNEVEEKLERIFSARILQKTYRKR